MLALLNRWHSFLQVSSSFYLCRMLCVNALQRATLISTTKGVRNRCYCCCVNALQRATLISTYKKNGLKILSVRVSMPSNGPHSFLRGSEKARAGQCSVSMPSNGPHSFLHAKSYKERARKEVSMPSNGPHSFLRIV